MLLLIVALVGLVPQALAAAPAYYHPDTVAAASAVFKRYAETIQPRYEQMEKELAVAGQASLEVELSVLLLGAHAPDSLYTYANDVRRQSAKMYVEGQRQVRWIEQNSTGNFEAAMNDALVPLKGEFDIKECAAASGIAAMTGPGRSGARGCEGTDLNGRIAQSMDQNKDLVAVVDRILAEPWPSFVLSGSPQPVVPLTGSGDYLRLGVVAQALLKDTLRKLADDLDARLEPIADGINAGDPAAMKQAEAARQSYNNALATEGEKLWKALEGAAKRNKWEVGLCANPPVLGGCPGTDKTEALLPTIEADPKVTKALKK